MAILKPSNISPNNISVDATSQIVVSWRNDGDRQYFSSITVYDNDLNTVAYSTNKASNLNAFQIIPANSLVNGKVYKQQITVWNLQDQSASSDWIVFKCSSAPVVEFSNLTADAEILNNNYLFQGTYTQAESVAIKSWQIILYDMVNNILEMSNETYSAEIEYRFSGFKNDTEYQIELQAKSQDGLLASTGKIAFTVRYEVPPVSINLEAENIAEKAAVRLQWNIVQVIGKAENYSYVDNEKLDVTNGRVYFDDGFNIDNNFTLKVWVESLPTTQVVVNENAQIISYKDPISNTTVLWLDDDTKEAETPLIIQISADPPTDTSYLWIKNPNQLVPKILNVSISINEPVSKDTLWVDQSSEDVGLISMSNASGDTISVKYYNNAFHLYENSTWKQSASVAGTQYYICIQQIGTELLFSVQPV
jgi:hypothetical protein